MWFAVPARGQLARHRRAQQRSPLLRPAEFSQEDMAKSLLHMISNDIGQLACLYARLHRLDRVYFGGFFIRGHPVTMRTITYSINFFSKVGAPPPAPPRPTPPALRPGPAGPPGVSACGRATGASALGTVSYCQGAPSTAVLLARSGVGVGIGVGGSGAGRGGRAQGAGGVFVLLRGS